jgi:hypothetical protein
MTLIWNSQQFVRTVFQQTTRHWTCKVWKWNALWCSGVPYVVGPSPSPPSLKASAAKPTLCKTFRPVQRSPSNFSFLKEFGLQKNTIFVCVSGKITIFLGHCPRIREETILLKYGPFFQNRSKFGRKIVRPLHFFSAFFDLCGRTVGQLATLLKDRRSTLVFQEWAFL